MPKPANKQSFLNFFSMFQNATPFSLEELWFFYKGWYKDNQGKFFDFLRAYGYNFARLFTHT